MLYNSEFLPCFFLNYKCIHLLMESDVWMVIFGHSVGESWSVRLVESRRFKVVLCLCFPQSDHIFNISLPATSEGQIAPTAYSLVWVRYWLRFWALIAIFSCIPKHELTFHSEAAYPYQQLKRFHTMIPLPPCLTVVVMHSLLYFIPDLQTHLSGACN